MSKNLLKFYKKDNKDFDDYYDILDNYRILPFIKNQNDNIIRFISLIKKI